MNPIIDVLRLQLTEGEQLSHDMVENSLGAEKVETMKWRFAEKFAGKVIAAISK